MENGLQLRSRGYGYGMDMDTGVFSSSSSFLFPLYQVSAVDKQRKFYPFSFRSDPSLARAVRTSHEVSLDGFPDLNLSIARECVELRQRSGCQEGCNAMDTLVCGWGCPRSEAGK